MLSDGRESESSYNSGNAKMSEAEQKAKDISDHEEDIMYSARYSDDHHEYRHVNLPREIARWVPQGRLMTEQEWRGLGVKQSPGWYHYMLHGPEPHILLFKRDK
ncbi:cyclin-dependent kinase regulatory subunit CKS1 [Chytriomyces cf. hyalinus JEL632]|nr:cyclin-dependent kinase regulatory subunit CKS1 [Chytriomyces cf. hyalinus JEL632]